MRDAAKQGKSLSHGVFWLLQVVLQFLAAAGVAELAQSFGLYLADAFAGDVELPADLFEGAAAAVFEAEAEDQNLLLTRSQGGDDLLNLLLEELV
jgi:hypothetical protein